MGQMVINTSQSVQFVPRDSGKSLRNSYVNKTGESRLDADNIVYVLKGHNYWR